MNLFYWECQNDIVRRGLLYYVCWFICSSLENKGANPARISQISFYGKFPSTKVLYKRLYLSAIIFFTTSKLLTFTFSRIRLSLRWKEGSDFVLEAWIDFFVFFFNVILTHLICYLSQPLYWPLRVLFITICSHWFSRYWLPYSYPIYMVLLTTEPWRILKSIGSHLVYY